MKRDISRYIVILKNFWDHRKIINFLESLSIFVELYIKSKGYFMISKSFREYNATATLDSFID